VKRAPWKRAIEDYASNCETKPDWWTKVGGEASIKRTPFDIFDQHNTHLLVHGRSASSFKADLRTNTDLSPLEIALAPQIRAITKYLSSCLRNRQLDPKGAREDPAPGPGQEGRNRGEDPGAGPGGTRKNIDCRFADSLCLCETMAVGTPCTRGAPSRKPRALYTRHEVLSRTSPRQPNTQYEVSDRRGGAALPSL
jgi:hypothetical protein